MRETATRRSRDGDNGSAWSPLPPPDTDCSACPGVCGMQPHRAKAVGGKGRAECPPAAAGTTRAEPTTGEGGPHPRDRRAVEDKGDPGFHRMPEDGFDITGRPAVACDDIGMPAMRRPVREQGRADIIRPVHDDDRSTLSDPRRHRCEIGGEGGVVSPAREGEQAEEMMRSQGYVTHIRPRSLPRGLTATSMPAASA